MYYMILIQKNNGPKSDQNRTILGRILSPSADTFVALTLVLLIAHQKNSTLDISTLQVETEKHACQSS